MLQDPRGASGPPRDKKEKKCINSAVVAISTSCGIWQEENHLINQSKTLCGEALQACCWRRSSSVLVLHQHTNPLPTVNHNSAEKAKSRSWLRMQQAIGTAWGKISPCADQPAVPSNCRIWW